MIELRYEYVAAFGTTMAIHQAEKIRKQQKKEFQEKLDQIEEAKDDRIIPHISVSDVQSVVLQDAFQLEKNLDQAAKNAQSNEKPKTERFFKSDTKNERRGNETVSEK